MSCTRGRLRSALIALIGVASALPWATSAESAVVQKSKKPIPGQYIVILNSAAASQSSAQAVSSDLLATYGGDPGHVYEHAVQGFSTHMTAAEAQRLARDPRVKFVEEDARVFATETASSWGLDRVDQRDLPLDTLYEYDTDASGVHAYIIDTGIRKTHVEFGGRVGKGFTAISDGRGTNDCYGHGTHVAGTVGGATYGVAKSVRLVPVRVLDCSGSGTLSGVIAGVDWVTAHRVRPAVANMSLGGPASNALDAAVNGAVAAGVTMVVAAGNDGGDACNRSPARAASAITVGATTADDQRSSFSNMGTCVDIFAPGSDITSAWNTSDTATNTISGTSMASPHAAGAAALFLAAHPGASPRRVTTFLSNMATSGHLADIGEGSPDLLLFTRFSLGLEPPSAASVTSPVPGVVLHSATVTFNWSAGREVSAYRLSVGTTVGGTDIYDQEQGTNRAATVSGLPLDGQTIYVRLASQLPSGGEDRDYTYTGESCGTPIAIGDAVSGELTATDCPSRNRRLSHADFYDFTATAGTQIYINLAASFDTYLYLYDSAGTLLASDDDGGDGYNSRIPSDGGVFTLPASGTFTMEATSYDGGIIGGYTLTLADGSTLCTYALSPTSASHPGSGGSATVDVTTGSACNWTAISNSSWITITSGESGTGNGTVSYTVAPQSGNVVRTGSMTIAGTSFTVTQAPPPCATTTAIGYGQTIAGALAATDCASRRRAGAYADFYEFTGEAGRSIFIQTTGELDTYLYLYDASGATIASDDDGGDGLNSRIPSGSGYFALPSTGTFTIEATSYDNGTTGDYSLLLGDTETPAPPAVVQFSAATYTGREGGAATITVTRSGNTDKPVSVDFATSAGSATPERDYTSVSGTLSFGPYVLARTVAVAIAQDAITEGLETVNLRLRNPSETAVLGARAEAVMKIKDGDGMVIYFSATAYEVSEGAPTLTATIRRSGSTADAATVRCVTASGTASGDIDFGMVDTVVTFAAGASAATVSVPIHDDTLVEGHETFKMMLRDPTGGGILGTQKRATVTIVDDETSPAVFFPRTTLPADESAGSAVAVVMRSGDTTGTVTVSYSTSDATATDGSDYVGASGTLTFAPGVVSTSFVVTLLNDAVREPRETFGLELSAPSGAVLGTQDSAIVTIRDDD